MMVWRQKETDPFPELGRRRIVILGATGSVGKSTLEVVRAHPERFDLVGLVANHNAPRLSELIHEFRPRFAVVADSSVYKDLCERCNGVGTELYAGERAVVDAVREPDVDLIVAAITGVAGLESVLEGLKAGKIVALANKESLVAGGDLVREALKSYPGKIVPVDSEHSAIFQALQGNRVEDIARLVLTASGGPFLKTPIEQLRKVNPEQALQHPNWKMGPKISVDSATMVNKALELIEAYWLFDIPSERIDVVVHPQSIVHSMIQYCDGSYIAQLSKHDMKGPVAYAMAYPFGRLNQIVEPMALSDFHLLEFLKLDDERFPAISLAKRTVQTGGNASAVFNLANEIAVSKFLNGSLGFERIVPFAQEAVESHHGHGYSSYEELHAAMTELRLRLG